MSGISLFCSGAIGISAGAGIVLCARRQHRERRNNKGEGKYLFHNLVQLFPKIIVSIKSQEKVLFGHVKFTKHYETYDICLNRADLSTRSTAMDLQTAKEKI